MQFLKLFCIDFSKNDRIVKKSYRTVFAFPNRQTKRSFSFPLPLTYDKIGLNKKENCANNSLHIATLQWQKVLSTPFSKAFFFGRLVLIFEQCYDRNHDHNHFISRHLSTFLSLFNAEKSLIKSGVFSISTTFFLAG